MENSVVEVSTSFGKRSNEVVEERLSFNSSKESRAELLNRIALSYGGDTDDCHDKDDFIEGKSNSATITLYNDWDDPTGMKIKVYSEEEFIEKMRKEIEVIVSTVEKFTRVSKENMLTL